MDRGWRLVLREGDGGTRAAEPVTREPGCWPVRISSRSPDYITPNYKLNNKLVIQLPLTNHFCFKKNLSLQEKLK